MSDNHDRAVIKLIRLKLLQEECTRLLQESCFKRIWRKSLNHGDEEASEEAKSISQFFKTDPAGKKICDGLKKMQKQSAEEGIVADFDISLLNVVLTSPPFKNHMERKHLNALKNIVKGRNSSSHQASVEAADYETISSQFVKALLLLDGTNEMVEEIKARNFDKIKERTSTDTPKMRAAANEAFKKHDIKRAIDLYWDAIATADDDSDELCILYSNRALAYLKLEEGDKEKNLYRAQKDANSSSKYNPGWYKPYVRLGQVSERLEELDDAKRHYETALALDPTNEHVKKLLDDVKRRAQERFRREHMYPLHQPMSYEERNKFTWNYSALGQSGNYPYIPSEIKELVVRMCDLSFDDVCKAHKYRDGSKDVKQDYEMAAKYYSKAVRAGNAEAMYNLALLTQEGRGVEKNSQEVKSLLLRAAAQPQTRIIANREIRNVGVAEAEYSMGLNYRNGIYEVRNDVEAVKWYERAVQHGIAQAANNLGRMYELGDGMDKPDLERAEDLFLLGHRRFDGNGALSLSTFYLRQKDPDRALMWFERALKQELSCQRAQSIEESFRSEVVIARLNKAIYAVKEVVFDRQNNVLPVNDVNRLAKAILRIRLTPSLRVTSQNNYDISVLKNYALKGSLMAKRLLEPIELLTGVAPFDRSSFLRLTAENFDVDVVPHEKARALGVVESVLKENTAGQLDRDARVAYALLNASEDVEPMIKFLGASLKRYPQDTAMLALLGRLHNYKQDYKGALAQFESALRRKPDNLLAMHGKATALRLLNRGDEALKQYEEFLSHAPADHPAVPESHYAMGCCLLMGQTKINEALTDDVEKHVNNGLESEGRLLPCFLPYKSGCKDYCSVCLQPFQKGPMAAEQESEPRSSRLTSPLRVELIVNFRKLFVENPTSIRKNQVVVPNMQHAQALPQCQEIELRDIDFCQIHELNGRVLHVTQIDIPLLLQNKTLCLVVEDVNKHVERVFIDGIKSDYKSLKRTYKIGTRLAIVNPRVTIDDGLPMVRVSDPESVVIDVENEVNAMCRFCGRPDSTLQCQSCNVAKYCSNECLEDDRKLLHHELICKHC